MGIKEDHIDDLIGVVEEHKFTHIAPGSPPNTGGSASSSREHHAQRDSTTPIATAPRPSPIRQLIARAPRPSASTMPTATAPCPSRGWTAQPDSAVAEPIIDVDEIAAQPDDLAELPLPDNSDADSDQSSSNFTDSGRNSDSSLEVVTAMPPLSNTHRDSSMPTSKFRAMATRRVMCGSHKYFALAKDLPPGTVNNIIPLRFS